MRILDEASPKVLFAAGLLGAIVGTPEYLGTGGEKGAAMAFSPAIAIKRLVHVSFGFMATHPFVAEDLKNILNTHACRWSLASASDLDSRVGCTRGVPARFMLISRSSNAHFPCLPFVAMRCASTYKNHVVCG